MVSRLGNKKNARVKAAGKGGAQVRAEGLIDGCPVRAGALPLVTQLAPAIGQAQGGWRLTHVCLNEQQATASTVQRHAWVCCTAL